MDAFFANPRLWTALTALNLLLFGVQFASKTIDAPAAPSAHYATFTNVSAFAPIIAFDHDKPEDFMNATSLGEQFTTEPILEETPTADGAYADSNEYSYYSDNTYDKYEGFQDWSDDHATYSNSYDYRSTFMIGLGVTILLLVALENCALSLYKMKYYLNAVDPVIAHYGVYMDAGMVVAHERYDPWKKNITFLDKRTLSAYTTPLQTQRGAALVNIRRDWAEKVSVAERQHNTQKQRSENAEGMLQKEREGWAKKEDSHSEEIQSLRKEVEVERKRARSAEYRLTEEVKSHQADTAELLQHRDREAEVKVQAVENDRISTEYQQKDRAMRLREARCNNIEGHFAFLSQRNGQLAGDGAVMKRKLWSVSGEKASLQRSLVKRDDHLERMRKGHQQELTSQRETYSKVRRDMMQAQRERGRIRLSAVQTKLEKAREQNADLDLLLKAGKQETEKGDKVVQQNTISESKKDYGLATGHQHTPEAPTAQEHRTAPPNASKVQLEPVSDSLAATTASDSVSVGVDGHKAADGYDAPPKAPLVLGNGTGKGKQSLKAMLRGLSNTPKKTNGDSTIPTPSGEQKLPSKQNAAIENSSAQRDSTQPEKQGRSLFERIDATNNGMLSSAFGHKPAISGASKIPESTNDLEHTDRQQTLITAPPAPENSKPVTSMSGATVNPVASESATQVDNSTTSQPSGDQVLTEQQPQPSNPTPFQENSTFKAARETALSRESSTPSTKKAGFSNSRISKPKSAPEGEKGKSHPPKASRAQKNGKFDNSNLEAITNVSEGAWRKFNEDSMIPRPSDNRAPADQTSQRPEEPAPKENSSPTTSGLSPTTGIVEGVSTKEVNASKISMPHDNQASAEYASQPSKAPTAEENSMLGIGGSATPKESKAEQQVSDEQTSSISNPSNASKAGTKQPQPLNPQPAQENSTTATSKPKAQLRAPRTDGVCSGIAVKKFGDDECTTCFFPRDKCKCKELFRFSAGSSKPAVFASTQLSSSQTAAPPPASNNNTAQKDSKGGDTTNTSTAASSSLFSGVASGVFSASSSSQISSAPATMPSSSASSSAPPGNSHGGANTASLFARAANAGPEASPSVLFGSIQPGALWPTMNKDTAQGNGQAGATSTASAARSLSMFAPPPASAPAASTSMPPGSESATMSLSAPSSDTVPQNGQADSMMLDAPSNPVPPAPEVGAQAASPGITIGLTQMSTPSLASNNNMAQGNNQEDSTMLDIPSTQTPPAPAASPQINTAWQQGTAPSQPTSGNTVQGNSQAASTATPTIAQQEPSEPMCLKCNKRPPFKPNKYCMPCGFGALKGAWGTGGMK